MDHEVAAVGADEHSWCTEMADALVEELKFRRRDVRGYATQQDCNEAARRA